MVYDNADMFFNMEGPRKKCYKCSIVGPLSLISSNVDHHSLAPHLLFFGSIVPMTIWNALRNRMEQRWMSVNCFHKARLYASQFVLIN